MLGGGGINQKFGLGKHLLLASESSITSPIIFLFLIISNIGATCYIWIFSLKPPPLSAGRGEDNQMMHWTKQRLWGLYHPSIYRLKYIENLFISFSWVKIPICLYKHLILINESFVSVNRSCLLLILSYSDFSGIIICTYRPYVSCIHTFLV